MVESFENWTVQLRKGLLDLCALSAIHKAGEAYGYELVRELCDIPGLDVSEGSVYPLLSRLRKQGWVNTKLVETTSGPARKYYTLTTAGRAHCKAMESYFDEVVSGITKVRKHS